MGGRVKAQTRPVWLTREQLQWLSAAAAHYQVTISDALEVAKLARRRHDVEGLTGMMETLTPALDAVDNALAGWPKEKGNDGKQ